MAGNARLVAMVGRNLLACRNSLQRVELNKIINRCFCDDSARKIEVKVEIVDEGADVRTCAHSTIKMGGRVFTSAKSSENDVERRTKRGSKRQFPKRKVRQGPVIELSSTRFFGAATWSLESRSIHDRLCRRDRPRLPAIEAHTVAVDGEFYPGWSIGTPLGAMAIGGGRSKLQWTPSGRPNALRSFDAPVFHDSCHLFQLTITAHIPANWAIFPRCSGKKNKQQNLPKFHMSASATPFRRATNPHLPLPLLLNPSTLSAPPSLSPNLPLSPLHTL